jgi:acetyl esterase/lipase
MMIWIRAASTAIVLLWAGAAAAQAPVRPPIEAFGQLPNLDHPVISPDGKHFAVLQQLDGRPVLVIYTVGAGPDAKPVVRSFPDWIFGDIQWAKNDRLIAYLTKDQKLGWGYEHANWMESWGRAVSFDASGSDVVVLFRHNPNFANNIDMSSVADTDLDDPDNVYIPLFAWSELLDFEARESHGMTGAEDSDSFRYDMFKVNVRTGDDEKAVAGGKDTREWYMDGHGHAVARVDRAKKSLDEHVMAFDAGNWREIQLDDAKEGRGAAIWGVSEDGNALVQSKYNENSITSLVRLDIATGKESPLLSLPKFDVDDAISDEWTGRIVGAKYIDDRPEYVYFDPQREALQRGLEAAFPGMTVRAESADVARDLVVVAVEGPRNPLTYYMLDRNSHRATIIGSTYPLLDEKDLGDVKPYPYAARDGLAIPAYLTLPSGRPPKNLPTVIFPHGGPEARDDIEFDWWAQFMANRGYAVLQPNFRGSSGYGLKFDDAGRHQWGLKMQDDITDGVKKLIADGIADPKRICIVGASYGGYAALAGATFTPDLYACAVGVAGVYDLPHFLRIKRTRSADDAAAVSGWNALVGDVDTDSDRLDATSPAQHADKVKCPVLLLHGDGDTTVPIEQSELEEAALKDAGKNVQFVRLEGDDHYLKLGTTRIRMLKEIESFLAANIGS